MSKVSTFLYKDLEIGSRDLDDMLSRDLEIGSQYLEIIISGSRDRMSGSRANNLTISRSWDNNFDFLAILTCYLELPK